MCENTESAGKARAFPADSVFCKAKPRAAETGLLKGCDKSHMGRSLLLIHVECAESKREEQRDGDQAANGHMCIILKEFHNRYSISSY